MQTASFNLTFTFQPKADKIDAPFYIELAFTNLLDALDNAIEDVINTTFDHDGFADHEYFRIRSYKDDDFDISMRLQTICEGVDDYTDSNCISYSKVIDSTIESNFNRWFGRIYLNIDQRLANDFYEIGRCLIHLLASKYEDYTLATYEDIVDDDKIKFIDPADDTFNEEFVFSGEGYE